MKIDSKDLDYLTYNIRIRNEQTQREIRENVFGTYFIVFLILLLGFVTCMTNYKVTKTLRIVEGIQNEVHNSQRLPID